MKDQKLEEIKMGGMSVTPKEEIQMGGMSVAPKNTEEKKWGESITDLYESDSKEPSVSEMKEDVKPEPTVRAATPNKPTKQTAEAKSWIKNFTPEQVEEALQYHMKDTGAKTYQELHDKYNIPFSFNAFKGSPNDLKKLLIGVKLNLIKNPKLSTGKSIPVCLPRPNSAYISRYFLKASSSKDKPLSYSYFPFPTVIAILY